MMTGLLALALGCEQPPAVAPTQLSDCDPVRSAPARDDCYARLAPALFRRDPAAGEILLGRIQDALVRDYVLLSLTREVDPSTTRWCDRIELRELAGRCRAIVRRPHLARGLAPPGRESPPR